MQSTSTVAKLLFSILVVIFSVEYTAAHVLEKAIEENGGYSDASSLYKISLEWYNQESHADALEVFHHLADSGNHILSCVKLGHHYAAMGNTPLAIQYFEKAGQEGPHHASIYNAGRLLAEQGDWVGALAYLKAAATLSRSYSSEFISKETTQSSLDAYDIVSRRLAREELTVVQVADVFIFGSLHDLTETAQNLWIQAVNGLLKLNQTVCDSCETRPKEVMEEITLALRTLWETFGITGSLSSLQIFLLLDIINKMLGPLAGLDDGYVPMAAGYAEALATHSIYCWDHYASVENDDACFNDAASNAISLYRRAGDLQSANRVLEAAQQHPHAATHWGRIEQTPRIYHPDLKAEPWWDETKFSAATSLMKCFESSKKVILKELQAAKALKEGRGEERSVGLKNTEIDPNGNTLSVDTTPGFRPFLLSNLRVHTGESTMQETGMGALAEFGPLFDGITWSDDYCQVIPTICNALKNDRSLCMAWSSVDSTKLDLQSCGAESVVTVLRLRPGTTILPQCGTTNSRLVMYFALEGAQGIELSVGGRTVKNLKQGDGYAVVFDDSFEHSLHHEGEKDLFIISAILTHPDLNHSEEKASHSSMN